jgi:hypothetical protein
MSPSAAHAPLHGSQLEALPGILVTLLSEALYGSAGKGYFLNPNDRGLLASLDHLSAQTASARPDGRSSVASHVEHLRYSLELLNRTAPGRNPWAQADWADAWTHQHVNDEQWLALRSALATEAKAWLHAMSHSPSWDESAIAIAVSSIPHLAYHLGAIRQLAQAAAGPAVGAGL